MPTFTAKPIFSWDNFFDLVYANATAAWGTYHGTLEQVSSLASGRRHRNPTPWKPGTSIDRQISVDLGAGVSKAANCIWLSGGHNYAGQDLTMWWSDNGSAWTALQTGITVGTDGKGLDDAAWAYLFEGTEGSHRYWRLEFDNVGAVDISVPSLWFGRMEQLSSYLNAPVDEHAGLVYRIGVERSDRGVASQSAASTKVRELPVRIIQTDEVASEFTSLIEPWMEHLERGGHTLAAIDWPTGGARLGYYRLQSDRTGAPFRVRGKHDLEFVLEEVK